MQICSESDFKKLVSDTPGLCAWGMGGESLGGFNTTFYQTNKNLLMNSYREFAICCSWLRDNCIPAPAVTIKSPTSKTLQQLAKHPKYVGNGAMIAAVIFLGIPYRTDRYSPYIQVGVSLTASCFRTCYSMAGFYPGAACHC